MNFQWISGVIIFSVILEQLIAGDVLYALTSGNVVINPQFKGDLKEILWKHHGHKAVEWDSTGHFQNFREFKGRTELNTETGQITINNLTDQHSGIYEAEGVVDGQIKTFNQNIEVLDPVQPKISCELNNTIATLSCRARGPQVKYKWQGPGQEETTWSQEERGPSFSSHSSGSDNYTCVARNPVSEKTQSFYTKDCPPLGKGINQCGERGGADSLIPGPGGNGAERNQEPFGKGFQSIPSKIEDVKDVNEVDLNSEEARTIEDEDRQMLLEQKTGTQNSNVTLALPFSPGGQPPPKPPRKPGSIRGPCLMLVGDKQSDVDTGNYAKQNYQESPVWFPATRRSVEDEGEKRQLSIKEGGLDYEEVGEDEVEKREMSDEKGCLDYEEGGMDREEGGKVYGDDKENKKGVHEEGNKEKGDEEEVRTQDTGGFEVEREEKVESCRGGTECEDKQEGLLPEIRPDEQQTDAEASTHCGTGKTTNPSENGSQRQSCHKSSPPPSNPRSPPPVPPKPSVRRHNTARPTGDTVIYGSLNKDGTVPK